jgi:hypothetical protein
MQGMARSAARRPRPDSRRWVLDGEGEAIFASLPQTILANLAGSRSESPLVWNVFYPLAARRAALGELLALTPLWGTRQTPPSSDSSGVEMYFWGYGLDGRPMPGLQDAVRDVDGPKGKTEVDLFLAGGGQLIAVEAKRRAAPGKCGRYARGRCPEVHSAQAGETCRYWEAGPADFTRWLETGERPMPGKESPPCSVHYQLFRTVVLGGHLAKAMGLDLGLWLIIPRANWPRLQPAWLDFTDRVRDEAPWRRSRVIAWEDLLGLVRARSQPR